jgi:hypothetical protein
MAFLRQDARKVNPKEAQSKRAFESASRARGSQRARSIARNYQMQQDHQFPDDTVFSNKSLSLREKLRLAELHRMINDWRLPLAKHGGDRRSQQFQAGRTNLMPISARGTTREYLLQRLKRDFPEAIERLLAGEHKSVFEAARSVGLVKPRTSLHRILGLLDKIDQASLKLLRVAIERRLRQLRSQRGISNDTT